MKSLSQKTKFFLLSFALTFPLTASADVDAGFDSFKDTMEKIITGSLGKAVALIALLLGGLIGLAKSSAWPALTGLAIAAIFGLGPFLINTIFDTFKTIA